MNVKVTGDDKFMGCSCSGGEKGTGLCDSWDGKRAVIVEE